MADATVTIKVTPEELRTIKFALGYFSEKREEEAKDQSAKERTEMRVEAMAARAIALKF